MTRKATIEKLNPRTNELGTKISKITRKDLIRILWAAKREITWKQLIVMDDGYPVNILAFLTTTDHHRYTHIRWRKTG